MQGLGTNGDWNFLYQGKEYIDAFGYNSYDFHARGFDSNLGRFDGSDPVDNYGISNYAGMMNNPTAYIDPDGRNPIIIGFMIGMFASAVSNMIKGTMPNSIGQFLTPGIVGAVGGGLGSLAPIGILPGIAYGAGSGAITGGLGAALSGGNIGRGALYGAAGGGIAGGVFGGIEANKLGANIWSGYREPHYLHVSEVANIANGNPAVNTQEYLDKLQELNFSDIKGVDMVIKGHVPGGHSLKDGFFLDPKDGVKAYAITEPLVWNHGTTSRLYFAPAAFSSRELLASTMAHEIGHSIHFNLGLSDFANEKINLVNSVIDDEGHNAIFTMQFYLHQKNNWNFNNGWFSDLGGLQVGRPYPALYDPIKTLIRKIIYPK